MSAESDGMLPPNTLYHTRSINIYHDTYLTGREYSNLNRVDTVAEPPN